MDPLNIYRYSDFIYNLFKFSGTPNRLRPLEYKRLLEAHGWGNITISPLLKVNIEYLEKVKNSLHKKYKNPLNQMDYLSIMVCATKI